MSNFDIFISYSSKDKSVAYQLVSHIEKEGFACWIAPRNIEGGVEYSEVIEKAILECKIFLLVFSENSEKSPWVKSELNVAFSENKYLIPYKIDSTPLKGTMRLLLNDRHWIENNSDEKKQLEVLLSAIKNYFTMLEKGETDQITLNNYYTGIAKRKRKFKFFFGISILTLLFLIGAFLFGMNLFSNKKTIKQYQDYVAQAFSTKENTINDMVIKRNYLEEAQKLEKNVPVSNRKDFLKILNELQFKLDSIYVTNLENARWFSNTETKHGYNQAIECYKIALQIKEDSLARNELKIILARKDNYE